jgi:hypothetical protein
MARETFAPERGRYFRIGVSLLPDGMRLHFSTDLLPMDGVSIILLLRQWAALYREPEPKLPPLAVSFRDYSVHLERLRATPAWSRALDYWKERMPHLPPAPDLPSAVAEASRHIAARHAPRCTVLGAAQACLGGTGYTPAVTLLSAFAETLRMWSRIRDSRLTSRSQDGCRYIGHAPGGGRLYVEHPAGTGSIGPR